MAYPLWLKLRSIFFRCLLQVYGVSLHCLCPVHSGSLAASCSLLSFPWLLVAGYSGSPGCLLQVYSGPLPASYRFTVVPWGTSVCCGRPKSPGESSCSSVVAWTRTCHDWTAARRARSGCTSRIAYTCSCRRSGSSGTRTCVSPSCCKVFLHVSPNLLLHGLKLGSPSSDWISENSNSNRRVVSVYSTKG